MSRKASHFMPEELKLAKLLLVMPAINATLDALAIIFGNEIFRNFQVISVERIIILNGI